MKKLIALFAAALLAFASATLAEGFDPAKLPQSKQTMEGKYLSAKQAYDLKAERPNRVLFIDVRTPAETEYVGIADPVDVNIPILLDDYTLWDNAGSRYQATQNEDFVRKVARALKARGMSRHDTIIVMCRSGDRSAMAANLLIQNGYGNVYSVWEGFEGDMGKDGRRDVNGWKNAGLPWGYRLGKSKAYLEN